MTLIVKWLSSFLLIASLALAQVTPKDPACIEGFDGNIHALDAAELDFSLRMLAAAVRSAPGQSVFFSPYSIYQALLLAYFSSANHTEANLKKTLAIEEHVPKLQVLHGYNFVRKMLGYRTNQSYEFNSADRLFVAQDVPIRDCIQAVMRDQIQHLDFKSNPEAARQIVNGWVASETRDHIKDLIPPSGITAATDLVLANAAYFKGKWQAQFDPAFTKKDIFYTSPSKHTMVDMMRQEGHFQHFQSENLGVHVLEMPYLGGDISMLILLPPFTNTRLEDTLDRLTPAELATLLAEDAPQRLVHVEIPKFSIEKQIELKPVLQQLGVGDLFDATADLSGLAPQGHVHLDDAVHKAKIEVDEQGSVAAAATALFSFRSSRPLEPAQFVCNHPFVYLLYDRKLKSILFMGLYRGPNV
ncbi:serine protease inhibitor 88Ea-like isoform X2 [Ctenocephalides felis]|uniref:serine protease inhibitor 88Ea-like isoform X2 n=1 Tax=Ctenocephalides felis TaxID=7515 RepID=UPI000E6E592B|nr:serine protease inhibitor 88Ea-like isoform X2 [Ctenocephalides felis]